MLTTPPEVRHVLAVRPEALTAHARIFVEEIGRWQKEQARARGLDGGETGAVTFVQRFSATLQSFVADVEEPAAIVAILRHLRLPTEAPPIARARDPAELGFGFE